MPFVLRVLVPCNRLILCQIEDGARRTRVWPTHLFPRRGVISLHSVTGATQNRWLRTWLVEEVARGLRLRFGRWSVCASRRKTVCVPRSHNGRARSWCGRPNRRRGLPGPLLRLHRQSAMGRYSQL